MWSWCPPVTVGMPGKQALVKGWAWGTGMNLREFAEMPAPKVFKCMWVNHCQRLLGESVLFQHKQFFCLHGPEQWTADSTSYQHSLYVGNVTGCSWNVTHPDRSLKLQSFKTVPLAKEVLSQDRLPKFSSNKAVGSQQSTFWGKVALIQEWRKFRF